MSFTADVTRPYFRVRVIDDKLMDVKKRYLRRYGRPYAAYGTALT